MESHRWHSLSPNTCSGSTMAEPEVPDPMALPPEPPPEKQRAGPAAEWQLAGNTKKQAGRGTALVVTIMLFIVVLAVFIIVIMIPADPYDPYVISIPITEYQSPNLALNPWAEQDADLLCSTFPKDADNTRKNAQSRGPFKQKLDEIRQLQDRWSDQRINAKFDPTRPLVVHICALGMVSNGSVYVLPADALVDDPVTWVRVDEILNALEECPAQNKLLILDLCRPQANPYSGPLSDDVALVLEKVLNEYKTPTGADRLPCPVFTACSKGEVSQIMPHAQVSAFAYYLNEGLQGEADGYKVGTTGERDLDSRVTLLELAEFVPARVQRWSLQNMGVTQTPRLHTRGWEGFDFKMRLQPVKKEPVPEPEDGAPPPPPQLFAYSGFNGPTRWQERDQQLNPTQRWLAGSELARWEAALIRADRLYAAYGDITRANAAIDNMRGYWSRTQQAAQAASLPPYASLARYREAFAATPRPEPITKLLDARDAYLLAAARGTVKADERERLMTAFLAAAKMQPEVAALSVWDWLVAINRPGGDEPPRDAYMVASATMREILGTRDTLYSEVVLVHAIALAERSRVIREAKATKFALLNAENASATALQLPSEGFLWTQDLLTEADELKRGIEVQIFSSAEPPSSAELARMVEPLNDAAQRFDRARERMQAIGQAQQVSYEALRVLSATATYAAESDRGFFDRWVALAKEALPLVRAQFSAPESVNTIPTSRFTQTQKLADLTRQIQEEWSEASIKSRTDPIPTDTRAIRQLSWELTVPLLTVELRQRIWDTLQQTAYKLHTSTRDLDEKDNASTGRTPIAGAVALGVGDPNRRATVSLLLLELSGFSDHAAVSRKVDAGRRASSPEGWAEASLALREAWEAKLPGQIKQNELKKQWDQANRLVRVFPTTLWPETGSNQLNSMPSVEVRNREFSQYRDWRRSHYGAYGTIRKDVPGASTSYDKAMNDLNAFPRN